MKRYLLVWVGICGSLLLPGCGGGDSSQIIPSRAKQLIITSGAPPSGTVGVPYGGDGFGFEVTSSGGVQPYNWNWAAASGSSLPPGLTLSGLGISGQPTVEGTYKVVITVTDSQAPPAHASASYSITIAPMGHLAITSGNPPDGVAGDLYGPAECGLHTCLYGFSLGATGGIEPYSWSWTGAHGSTTPPGLSIQTSGKCGSGNFSGGARIICIPTTAGIYKVVITVKDSASPPNQVSVNYTIQIVNPPPPAIVTFPPPPGAALNLPYAFQFTADPSGLAPLTWSETGALPAGLTMSSGGWLSGTPTATGTFPITVMVTDAGGQTATPQDFTILVAAHGFKVTGFMAASRRFHDSALLQDGTVLVTGGTDPYGASLSSAELYDAASRTFSAAATMAAARSCHTGTLLKDGRVLAAGGFDGTNVLATAEIFDPAKRVFTTTGDMAAARACHTATLLKDGRVLIVGGFDSTGPLATAELFDPANGTFSSAGTMGTARLFHTATLLPDGKVLVTGGADAASDYSIDTVASAELFDPATGLFSATTDMSVARFGHTATLLSTGKVLIAGGSTTGNFAGGESALTSAEIFDPATGGFSGTGSMSLPRTYHTATLLDDGTVLVAGGDPNNIMNLMSISVGNDPSPLNAAELFDPGAGTFTGTGGLITARENHAATLLNDGTVLITGGFWNGSTAETYQ